MENMPEEANPYYIWDAGCSLSSLSSSSSFSSSSSSSSPLLLLFLLTPPPLLLLTGTASLQQWCCGRGCRRDGRLIRGMLPPSASTASTSTQPSKVSPKVFSRPMFLFLKCQYLLTELPMRQRGLTMPLLGLLWGRAVMLVVGMKALWGMLLLLLMPLLVLGNPDAKRLYDDLLSNYNRLIRWLLLLLFILISWKRPCHSRKIFYFNVQTRNVQVTWNFPTSRKKYHLMTGVWVVWCWNNLDSKFKNSWNLLRFISLIFEETK